jgi:hypothetical protein
MNPKNPSITIYLGIYNAEKYLDSLFEQIKSQDNQNFKLLVVDNNSLRINKNMFRKWETLYKNNFKFVQNKINYGGHGSLFKNIDKIKTKWFCTLHQDDFYKSNHISTLVDLISEVENNVVGVSTTMGSMTLDGKILNSKPRASWFSYNLDEPGQFLQNLKSQAVPYPATAFKLAVFKKTFVPFHNPTFSDTEQTLKMLAYGRFIFSQKETMYYRENPKSESHTLNKTEISIGSGVALSRVVNSIEFKSVIKKVSEKNRGKFVSQLTDALSFRISDGELLKTLQINALEVMVDTWGYKQTKVSEELVNKYVTFSSPQTIQVISQLSNIKSKKNLRISIVKPKISFVSKVWDKYFQTNLRFFSRYNKFFLKSVHYLIFIVKPNHRLKNKWK